MELDSFGLQGEEGAIANEQMPLEDYDLLRDLSSDINLISSNSDKAELPTD